MLALPSRVAVAPSATRWSGPALAVGAALSATVTVTVSLAVSPPGSVTVRLKVRVALPVTVGAAKVGLAVLALLSVTVVPAVWLQA